MNASPTAGARPLRLALTLGDPAGVGPEIILRFFEEGLYSPSVLPFVVGEARHLDQAMTHPEIPLSGLRVVSEPPTEPAPSGIIPVVEPPDFTFHGELTPGRVSDQCGAAAWAYVRHAVHLVQSGQADAVVTAPIHKEALHAAGCPFPGHTEMLADLAGGVPVSMLLVGGGLRAALATIHEPLARVPGLLKTETLLEQIRLLDRFIPLFGLTRPRARIGVTGLNPHAGEGGMFGQEEAQIIVPAIEQAQAEGLDVAGPLPADTAFFFHRRGAYDALLAMYHDQALIPVKTLDFHGGVNVTMGLPFIRTSVDHGTAFDIAWRGEANPGSLRAAVACAATLAGNWRKREKSA
ncbi:MAG TPA: 4-hydroxythreonine-4-phosphate dehydrogenase PdxA [Candidatus Sumerlaeota bacterium]|nr:4-hydroxythreonine-4-phosphate dehydrogenase PdxA [Candidatus Sumerlaeota bacterium]